MKEQLFKEFVSKIDLRTENTTQFFAIGMVGLVGAGKSTVAQELARYSGAHIATNDAIRRFLNQKGYEGMSPAQDIVQYIAESLTVYLYERHISHIIDNDLLKFHESARAKAAAYGAKFYLVRVECPEKIILQRLKARQQTVASNEAYSLSRADVEEFKQRKAIHNEYPQPAGDFSFRTDKPLKPQVLQFLEQNRLQKY